MAADPRVPPDLVNFLKAKSGLHPLPAVDAGSDAVKAAEIFNENGFVVVRGALFGEALEQIQKASKEVISALQWYDPKLLGTRGSRRYSFASLSSTQNQLHRPEWARLIDIPSISAILREIWGSQDYACYGGGGDFCFPGALEHQFLHSDVGSCQLESKTAPWISVNFCIEPQTPFNGPMRIIPGTQHSCMWTAPHPCHEPTEMLLSTISPLDEGAALIRDLRCWHGGTPNISSVIRALPSVEFVAPCTKQEHYFSKMLPYKIWKNLSPHGKRVSRYICAPRGQWVEAHMNVKPGRHRVMTRLIAKFEPVKTAFAQKARRGFKENLKHGACTLSYSR